ncbi:TPA: zinc-binding dehydrogenase, partial [Enterococcus faecium]|nr:zinc-binding dehydrogenase [Enterococcus faecium]
GFASDIPIRSLSVLRERGTLVRVAPGSPASLQQQGRDRGVFVTPEILVEPDGVGLSALGQLIDARDMRVEVERVYPLDELAEAHRRGEEGRTAGKLVVQLMP